MTGSYVHGASAVPLMHETIGATFDRIAAERDRDDSVASTHQGVRRTYGELRRDVERVACGLLALGVTRGDRVGICSANCLEWLIALYAITKAGGVLVTISPALSTADVEQALDHAGVSVLFAGASGAGVARIVPGRPPALRHVVWRGGTDATPADSLWHTLLAGGEACGGEALQARAADIDCDDPAVIMYTSGTTGVPKGATLSHHSLLNSAFFIGERLRYTPADRLCLPMPLGHTMGLVLGALAVLTHGSALILPAPLFDARNCLDTIARERCTAFYGVPAMFSAVLQHPAFSTAQLVSLRTGVMAGAPCPVDLMREVMDRMHLPELTVCYGMTEAGTVCQTVPDDPIDRRVATVGAVHPHVECKVVDPDTGRIVPRETAGELWARGYCLMSRYWNDARATSEIKRTDGWLRTGDLAVIRDDGYVTLVGRLKDIIIAGGRNIHAREIEDVIKRHDHVLDAAVIGVPGAIYGESACAWIQVRDGRTLTADDVRRFCRAQLPSYKVPRRVRFTAQLPLTASGKVQKFRLRERMLQELGLADTASASASLSIDIP